MMLVFLKETLDYVVEQSSLIKLGRDIQQIETIMECLANANHISECDRLEYPNQLGRRGRLGEATTGKIVNKEQYRSSIYKIHIALQDEDFQSSSWRKKTPELRTSDNYVLYTKHLEIENCILVLGIVSPEAHKRIETDISLTKKLIDEANFFQDLTEREILISEIYFVIS